LPSLPGVTAGPAAKSQLVAGWNLLTRNVTIDGVTSIRTFLVYGDNTSPTLAINPAVQTTIYSGDWNSGATWGLSGMLTDDSFGTVYFGENFKLGDPNYFPGGIQQDSQGEYAVFELVLQDLAGNQTLITLTLRITDTAPPLGTSTTQPTYIPSTTLIAILDPDLFKNS
jgi:hypothetical protein